MVRLLKKSAGTRGLPPGSIVHIGEKKIEQIRITLMDYTSDTLEEKDVKQISDCFHLKETPSVSWINIDGLHDVKTIESIGNHFSIHPLVLEDIVNTDQRPKLDDMDTYLFLVLKMFYVNQQTDSIESEQVSIVLGDHYVFSFQEKIGDVFDAVRERIRTGKGRIRKMGADYLAYSLMDAIVDNYFTILERIGDKIEIIEEDVVANPSPGILQQIYNLKQDMVYLRKSVWPIRDLISSLLRIDIGLIKKDTSIYLRDLYDHTIQVIDTIETFRDMISGMLDIYMSSVSNKMNEIMKVLTIFASIFIPLTFITGVYGMNFHDMPELSSPWGYPAVWIVIMAVAVTLLLYFRHRHWL